MTLPYLSPLDNESSKAYDMFCAYRDMGAGRSIDAVVEKSGKRQGYARHLSRWSSKYQWVERAKLYDAYLANKHRKQRESEHADELDQYREQLARTSKAALTTGQRMLKLAMARLETMEQSKEPIPPKSLPSFVKAANDTITSAMDGWGMALSVDELMTLLGDIDDD